MEMGEKEIMEEVRQRMETVRRRYAILQKYNRKRRGGVNTPEWKKAAARLNEDIQELKTIANALVNALKSK